MFECKQLYNVTHPFIDAMYMKKEFNGGERKKRKVLVIETKRNVNKVTQENRDEQLQSFLADLDLIKDAIERTVGKFDRLDIRCH